MVNKDRTLGFDKIYVINLKRRNDRKETLIKENPELDFTFIEAVDGKNIDIETLQSKGILGKSFYDPTGMVTHGIFACALSHKKAWDQALKDGVQNALFLEDDIVFTIPFIKDGHLTDTYLKILEELNEHNWDIVQYGKKSAVSAGINISENFVMPRYKTNFDGAHCYGATRDMISILSDKCLPVSLAADVYIETFYNTHNIVNLKTSLVRQKSDTADPQNADSDTYYNSYREGGGKVGISFDSNGNVLNKAIAQYIKHPKDITQQHTEIVIQKYTSGKQKFNGNSYFGITDLLKFVSKNTGENSKMIELNSHTGENTFFFGCSSLFTNIYTVDNYSGEDKFNIENNMSWEDIEIAYSSNTCHFNNISHFQNNIADIVINFKDISFVYINNRGTLDIKKTIEIIKPVMRSTGYIGGNGNIPFTPLKTFDDGNWVIKV